MIQNPRHMTPILQTPGSSIPSMSSQSNLLFRKCWNRIHTSRSNVRLDYQGLEGLAALNPLNELFRVEIGTNRIFGEYFGFHEFRCFTIFREGIDLSFNNISVGIVVIQRDCQPMVDTPERFDTLSLALTVRQKEIFQSVKCESEMLQRMSV